MEEMNFKELIIPWHHLIFCEELVNNDDGENDGWHDYKCRECDESVVGHPAYKCLECNFLQHKSCINQTQPHFPKRKPAHFPGDRRHHLILIEDVENAGNEEVRVCAAGCEEPVFGRPAYKCSIPYCTFFLHKCCTDLPHLIQHPMHPEHTLFLRDGYIFRSSSRYCEACCKNCEEPLFYGCSLCNFKVDIKCGSRWRINAADCHQHAFVPTSTQIQLTCQACGEEFKDIAYICSICLLMIHRKCSQFQPTIKTEKHEHLLTRTYSLRQVTKQQDKEVCKLCGKEVNVEYGAYYCQTCDHHIAHLNCAYEVIDDYFFDYCKNINELMASNSDDYQTHVVHLVEGIKPVEDPREIKHSLSDKKLKVDHKRCEACMQFIIFDASFFSFNFLPNTYKKKKNFLLHSRCTKLPDAISRTLFHEHPLTLHLDMDRLFWCTVCRRYRNGFAYTCDDCQWSFDKYYNYDVQCCLIPDVLDHEGHPHPLYICVLSSDEACNACGENVEGVVKFNCTDHGCNKFSLCIRCATLPLVARYEYDAHLLQLAYTREYDPKGYHCLICKKKRHPDYWFYYCQECKFTAHPGCVIGENPSVEYGRTYKDEHHQHPLTIVKKTEHSPPCDACDKSFDEGVALQCTRCKFNVHQERIDSSFNKCLEKYQVKE